MPDREKVKAFLQHLGMNAYEYKQADDTVCGYDYLEVERIADDAIALLKEQEAVVRCKDCKRVNIDQRETNGVWCPAHAEWHENNWFCADGEKRDE